MSKRCIGVVVPKQDLVAVFYEEGKLIQEEIISLVVSDCPDTDRETIIVEPLLLGDSGLINVAYMASYLGIEKKNKPLDWSKGIKKIKEQKNLEQEAKRVSKLSAEDQVKELDKVYKKIDQKKNKD